MKNRKTIVRAAIALVVISVIALAVAKKKGLIGEKPGTKVTIEQVQKRTLVEIVSASGKIQPEIEVKLSPDISGEVVDLVVKEGDPVKAGQFLAKINPEIYLSNFDRIVASLNMQKANLSNARARLAQTKAQFLNTTTTFERNKSLFQQSAISPSEYDASRAAYLVAEAEVEAAEQSVKAAEFSVKSSEAAVKEARENLTKTSIYAPMDGTISKLSIEKGERVVGTSQFAGTEMMRIANLSSMEVNVSVAENDIVRVNLGDTALVEVDAYLNRKFKGVVTSIATSANLVGTTVDQVTNFEVKIRILADSYADLARPGVKDYSPFRPGMSATVDIQTQSEVDVLSVPIQAVTTRADTLDAKKIDTEGAPAPKTTKAQTIEYVFVFDNEVAKLVKVKTGIQDNMHIQILEGLDEQNQVITGPYRAVSMSLKDGDHVKKVDRKELYSVEK